MPEANKQQQQRGLGGMAKNVRLNSVLIASILDLSS